MPEQEQVDKTRSELTRLTFLSYNIFLFGLHSMDLLCFSIRSLERLIDLLYYLNLMFSFLFLFSSCHSKNIIYKHIFL